MAHIHEKIDFTVEVFAVYGGKVLLRKHDKYKIWLSVGGHIELDEDPNQAAIRECKEEIGIDIQLIDSRRFKGQINNYKELITPVGMNRHKISDTHEHVTSIYFAKTSSDKVIPENATDEWKWCSVEDIDSINPISESVKYYAKRALEEIK